MLDVIFAIFIPVHFISPALILLLLAHFHYQTTPANFFVENWRVPKRFFSCLVVASKI
jgi:hypothetical protein